MPAKHTTVFPLRRYGFIGGAATLLVVLVSWVAVRAVGPTQPDARVPLMVQPTMPLAAGPGPSLIAAVPSLSPSASKRPSPTATTATTRPTPTSTAPKPTEKATTKPTPRRTTSPTPAAAFTGSYTTGASWDRGFVGTVTVTNRSGPERGWTVKITFADRAGVRVGNVWNARVDRQGDTFVFTGGPLAPGASATLGFEASKQVRGKIQPSGCTVDGGSCRVN